MNEIITPPLTIQNESVKSAAISSAPLAKTITSALTIIQIVLHQIDVTGRQCKPVPMNGDQADLNDYLGKLLHELNKRTERRAYEFQRDTTEFYSALSLFAAKLDLDLTRCNSLADRLLTQEISVDDQYGRSLGAKREGRIVPKGSFLQFLYKDANGLAYLGVKLEHQTYVDEKDFKRRSGLPEGSKVYKACHANFNASGVPTSVHAYDTNSKPAAYWWKEFLELAVIRDDKQNTAIAVKAVVRVVGNLKSKFPHDHTVLRNAVIGAFRQGGVMNYSQFIQNVFNSYEPYDVELLKQLPLTIKKLQDLPLNTGFDTQFDLIPSEVEFRRTKVELTDEISIDYKADLNNISSKIWSERMSDGRNLVVIHSETAYKYFTPKTRSE